MNNPPPPPPLPPRDQPEPRAAWLRDNVNSVGKLKGQDLNDDDAVIIADQLKKNDQVREPIIHLDNNNIGPIGAVAIVESISPNSLVSLWLSNNNIGSVGAEGIAGFLGSSSLRTIVLDDNNIGPISASAIANAVKRNETLEDLHLAGNQIGDTGAIAIAEMLTVNKKLCSLDLARNQIGDTGAIAIGKALPQNQKLEWLSLDRNQIGDTGAIAIGKALFQNKKLERLDLDKNQIGDTGAIAIGEALPQNTSLGFLSLEMNNIGPNAAIPLARFLTESKLAYLHLSSNNISAVGAVAFAEMLKRNTALNRLYLGDNGIGPIGAARIADAVAVNSSLIDLGLTGNAIGNHGAQALASAVKRNSRLEHLNVGRNNIGSLGIVSLAEAYMENVALQYISVYDNGSAGRDAAVAEALVNMGTASYWGRLCLRIRRNHHDMATIDVCGIFDEYGNDDPPEGFPVDFARRLGESLVDSSVVTKLEIPLDEDWQEIDIYSNLEPLLRFIRSSRSSLRHLTYNFSWRWLDGPINPIVARHFFQAVANRSSVIDFELRVSVDWLEEDEENLNLFASIMGNAEYRFLKNLILCGGPAEILKKDQFVAAMVDNQTLQSLRIESRAPCAGFLRAWAGAPRRTKFWSLAIDARDGNTFEAIFAILPSLAYLREFRLRMFGEEVAEMWRDRKDEWIRALEQHGSLRSVELVLDGIPLHPQLRESRLVALYCSRNERFPALLTNPRVANDEGHVNEDGTPVRVYPRLFHRALQCPSQGTRWILEGLAKLDDHVGPSPSPLP